MLAHLNLEDSPSIMISDEALMKSEYFGRGNSAFRIVHYQHSYDMIRLKNLNGHESKLLFMFHESLCNLDGLRNLFP